MAIDSVSNSGSNAGLYAGGAALVGAGAGVATAYLTKPFLKDGAPTDSFCKALGEKILETSSEMNAEDKKSFAAFSSMYEKFLNANNIEEVNNVFSETLDKMFDEEVFEEFKAQGAGMRNVSAFSMLDEKPVSRISKAKSLEEAKEILRNSFKSVVEKEGFDKFKSNLQCALNKSAEEGEPATIKDLGKGGWNLAWDSKNNKLIEENMSEEALAVVKKTMHSFQGKAAMLYGAIGAGVLGLATLLCCSGAKKEVPAEASQKVDTQA